MATIQPGPISETQASKLRVPHCSSAQSLLRVLSGLSVAESVISLKAMGSRYPELAGPITG